VCPVNKEEFGEGKVDAVHQWAVLASQSPLSTHRVVKKGTADTGPFFLTTCTRTRGRRIARQACTAPAFSEADSEKYAATFKPIRLFRH
jgi:hypothetical protein